MLLQYVNALHNDILLKEQYFLWTSTDINVCFLQNEKEETDRKLHVNQNGKQGKNSHHDDDDASSLATVSSPEPEEYTYERAIQGYVNFAETRVKSRTAVTRTNLNSSREQLEKSHILELSTEKMSNGHNAKGLPSPPHTPRRQSGAKIEEKLSALEKRRHSSTELNSNVINGKKLPMAKGDVLKRREMFERACEQSEQVSKPTRSLSEGNQEKLSHPTNKDEARFSVKEKVMQKSSESIDGKNSKQMRHRFSNGDLSSTLCVQKRLSQLENQGGEKDQISGNISQSIKERLSNLDSTYSKDDYMNSTADKDPSLQAKLANIHSIEQKAFNGIISIKDPGDGSARSLSPEDDVIYETKRQQFHRSLDSLDVEGSNDACSDAFERVQSLEDLDCCRHAINYPVSASSTEILVFSSQSGDTDRDDSGIHTADVSCSVSQADEPVDDAEIIATINSVVPHLETSSNGVEVYHLEVEIVNQKHLGSRAADQKSPLPDPTHNVVMEPTEMATAFLDVKGNLESEPAVITEMDLPQMQDRRNNSVSPQLDANISSSPSTSLMVVMEENDNSVDVEVPQCLEHAGANITSLGCSSLVMEIPLGHSHTINESSCVDSENTADFSNTLTNVAELIDNSFDSKNQSCTQNDTATLTDLQTVLPEVSKQTYGVVETDNNDSSIPVIKSENTEQFPKHLPVENASTTLVACTGKKDPVHLQKKVSVADKRKTVVEVCEKISVDGDGTNEGLKSPPPTPYIEVPNFRLIPFQVSYVSYKIKLHNFYS
jgi:hypothetical protein